MIDLRQIVQRYSVLTGKSGEPVSLEKFGMNQQETEKVFSELDEDYHISRFLHFSLNDGPAYQIS